LPYFIVEFEPQKKHFLHHINNKCCKGKYLSTFPKISPLKMTNKPKIVLLSSAYNLNWFCLRQLTAE
ncbi:MAG: hypothetical protein IJV44_07965, partial [Prevotella sp.]|nr:hypothetical protein [Prevotella sp.]